MRIVAFIFTVAICLGCVGSTVQAGDVRVAVQPFHAIGGATSLGNAVASSLSAELARIDGVQIVNDNATHLITGEYQSAGDGLRFTGKVFDTRTGRSVGALKATGTRDDLFNIEDILAAQAKRAIYASTDLHPAPLEPLPTIVPSGPLTMTGKAVSYKGIAPADMTDRDRAMGDYRHFYGVPWSSGYGCGFGYGYGLCGYRGISLGRSVAYFPRGF